MNLASISLDDKYTVDSGTIYITGSQALVRLPLMQIQRDRAAGNSTACFISGYRGSPMHNLDKELWRAKQLIGDHPVHFQPAVNEDLAATSAWGSQQVALFDKARYDGVFAMWYGKGPGLDRSLDAMRHANHSGTSALGGVLAIVGDDHGMMSTDVPAASEPTFIDLMMPMLYPGNVAELIEYGLYGIALSRFTGAWVGFKAISDTLDAVASVEVDPSQPRIILPGDFPMPVGGVHIREPDDWKAQEPRQRRAKMDAALEFARVNQLNRLLIDSKKPRLGIVASGKAAYDVVESLRDMGIDPRMAGELGIKLLKIAMPHPLDLDQLRNFGDGLDEVLVVEEKRRIIETAMKDALYALPDGRRPRVVGRFDENGDRLLSELGEINADRVAEAVGSRVKRFHSSDGIENRLQTIQTARRAKDARNALGVARTPYFCSGCPHNSSTKVPQGSLALGGVGCHFMATYMDRDNITHTHMGGEGANWIGIAPFVEDRHIFQNLGDGTYFHSGLLAIRACVASNTTITYKILFNDAVAMTGGQPHDGPLSPSVISRQVYGEGVRKIVVVTDDLQTLEPESAFAPNTYFEHRDGLDRVQRDLRNYKGVSVIIYVQTCAAEKRRRRKRGAMIDPPHRVFINQRVCEGCGDCSVRSNCLSVVPIETEYGRKRRVDQSSCNKDFRCRDGFCPSFVTVTNGAPRRKSAVGDVPAHLRLLAEPERPVIAPGETFNVLVTGIGGTGVVTVGAMLTMAAHLEGKACSSVDQFGMAQKGGAVTSHVRIANTASDIHAVRLGAGTADLLLGCDNLVAAGDLALETLSRERTHAIVNDHKAITGQFTRNPDIEFPLDSIILRVAAAAGDERVDVVAATRLATALMGDSIATNLFMLGYAYQKGFVPVSAAGIERAIEMNGVAIESNKATFMWGRRAAIDPAAVHAVAEGADQTIDVVTPESDLDLFIERRREDLVAYQDEAYGARYTRLVESVRSAEHSRAPGRRGLTEAVARYAYKLMAYKDEYEVARLYTDGVFAEAIDDAFEGDFELALHLAPPLLARRDRETGLPAKRCYGRWMLKAMRWLARYKHLRGTPYDIFGYTKERKRERQTILDYVSVLDELTRSLDQENHALAVELASVPEMIRGYGYIKDRHFDEAKAREAELLSAWRSGKSLDRAV